MNALPHMTDVVSGASMHTYAAQGLSPVHVYEPTGDDKLEHLKTCPGN